MKKSYEEIKVVNDIEESFVDRLMNKCRAKAGGFKELLYDNLSIVLVGVLISVTIVVIATKSKTLGEDVTKSDGRMDKAIKSVEDLAPTS